VAVTFDGLDVPRLLSYAPAKLPLEVQSGKLAGDLKLRFVMSGDKPSLTVSGTADLTDASIVDTAHAPAFSAHALHVAAAGLQPLAGVYRFDEIRLDQPVLHLLREHSGELSIARAFASAPASSPKPAPTAGELAAQAASAARGAASAAASAPDATSRLGEIAAVKPAPLDVSIKHFALNDGSVALEDRGPDRPVALDLTNL